jgi:DNA helicase II / ATP-dependent DNA helicase PcrA
MLADAVTDTVQTMADRAELRTHNGSPLVVHGPAGSGKTTLLLERFQWLVEQGTGADRIALVAPSLDRAAALRTRIEDELDAAYGELVVVNPSQLAGVVLRRAGGPHGLFGDPMGRTDRLAMLAERVNQLPLQHHDFGGDLVAMLGTCLRRIDRLKAELVSVDEYLSWAQSDDGSPQEREFAEIFAAHDRILRELGAHDETDPILLALKLGQGAPHGSLGIEHVLVDDAQELGLAAARLVVHTAGPNRTIAGDGLAAGSRFRGAGEQRMQSFETADSRVARLVGSERCLGPVMQAAWAAALGPGRQRSDAIDPGERLLSAAGTVNFWRCSNVRSQSQNVAAEIERLISRQRIDPGRIAVLVPELARDGRAVSLALEERAVPHTVVGENAFYQRAEIRDLLAWMRLLVDPSDAAAVVRAVARPPIDLRSVDIARCTQIARRRKLDMVAALAAATESPQVPPEARDRIRGFLKLYRACAAHVDTMRPDLYVHRLIDRLGLRRQQLFAAHADVVERLQSLARFGEIASAYAEHRPQATAREFARSITVVAEYSGRGEQGIDDDLATAAASDRGSLGVRVLTIDAASGIEAEQVYVIGLSRELEQSASLTFEPVADALLHERLPADGPAARAAQLRARLYTAISRASTRVVLAYSSEDSVLEQVEDARAALGAVWEDRDEELFGPGETLQSTFRTLRDELLDGTVRAGARLAELRLDTDIDVSHAVVRYLELLKLSALIAREDDQNMADALRDINARIGQAATAEQREILESSPLDDYLLDAERDTRRRAQLVASRDEPSLERFLPMRGDGVLLSATDIDTYRSCPLKYKFARVFRIPQEPTIHQRFGIVVHQVLERFHAAESSELGSLDELLALLEQSWRRSGFTGATEEERQLYAKASSALIRYHERACEDAAEPVWFERQFSFKLGPHLVRGRVDRVDRLASGAYELIDYKTGRPKPADQLADDVQLSLYAIGAREAWGLETSQGAYYYLLDDVKATVPGDAQRRAWITEVATDVAEHIKAQEFEPTPSARACGFCDYRLICPAAER